MSLASASIRDQITSKGFSGIDGMATDIAKSIETVDASNQVEFLKLQQKTESYNNTISLMTNILKGLADTDKEVIRNT